MQRITRSQVPHRYLMARILMTIFISFLIHGCTSSGARYKPYPSTGKTLAYKIDVPDQLQLKWIGTTVFNNASTSQTVTNWNVADHLAQHVETVLRDSANFTRIIRLSGSEQIAIGQPIADRNTDVLLVIRSGRSTDTALGTNQNFSGLGLVQRSGFGMGPYSAVSAALEAELFDARTGKSLRKTANSSTGGASVLMDKSMRLSSEQLSLVTPVAASLANRVSTICMENLGLKPWVKPIDGRGNIPVMKF
jgi:hypothetical protein